MREGCSFYAGTRLKDSVTRHNLGALCIVVDAPKQNLDRSQRDTLAGFARLLTKELDRRPSEQPVEGQLPGKVA